MTARADSLHTRAGAAANSAAAGPVSHPQLGMASHVQPAQYQGQSMQGGYPSMPSMQLQQPGGYLLRLHTGCNVVAGQLSITSFSATNCPF